MEYEIWRAMLWSGLKIEHIIKHPKHKMKKNEKFESLNSAINKIDALSTGTGEKFRIIHVLRDGEKAYADIHKKFPTMNKSTMYKYLDDLFCAEIIKKRVEKVPGKRPFSYYSLASLTLDLSPAAISKFLGYGSELADRKINLMFGEIPKFKLIGKDGKETEFYPSILMEDLLDAGLRIEDAAYVLNSVSKSLYKGISTTEIGDAAIESLKNIDSNLSERFKKFIEPHLNVLTDSKKEVWNRNKISEMIKEKRKIRELSTAELKFLSHKIIRNIKKLTQEPSEELVAAYVNMLANSR